MTAIWAMDVCRHKSSTSATLNKIRVRDFAQLISLNHHRCAACGERASLMKEVSDREFLIPSHGGALPEVGFADFRLTKI